MDSKLSGMPLSATAQSSPKVSLSTSSGSSFSSLPIRAPPTVDSDYEFSISTNAQENIKNTSSCSNSDSGFESEGFLSGEDGFETASERPLVADPDDETLEQTDFVDNHVVFRPFVNDPCGETSKESGLVEGFVVSRPFVVDSDEETLSTPMEEEGGENFGEPAVVDIGILGLRKPGVPIAMLSRDSDDDSIDTEEVEDDDGFLGSVRVPGIDMYGKTECDVKVKVLEVEEEEEEEDESQFEPALESLEVVGDSNKVVGDVCISAKDSANGSVSAELIKEKGSDTAGEATVESFVAIKEGEEVNSQFEPALESEEVVQDSDKVVNEDVSVAVKDPVNSSVSAESIKEQELDDAEEATLVSFVANEEDIHPENSEINTDVLHLVGEFQGHENMEVTTRMDMVIDCDKEVLERSEIIASGIGKAVPLVDETKGSILTEIEAKVDGEIDSERNFKIRGAEVLERNGACSSVVPVDSATAENGIQNMDNTVLEPYPVQETKYYGNGHLLGTNEGKVIEEELHCKSNAIDPLFLGSNLDPEMKAEMEDEAGHGAISSEEGSFSAVESKGLTFDVSDTTKLIVDDLEQGLSPTTSVDESSLDLLHRAERPIVGDSDEDVDMDEESEGKELFDSNILAALLKAATGTGSGGGNYTVTSANGSSVFSLEHPADSSTLVNSLRPSLPPNRPSLFTASELMTRARGESEENLSEEEKKKLEKMQTIRVKFLRLVQKLGRSPDDSVAAQVLYRLVLAAGRPSSQSFSLESAKRTAMQLEAEDKNDLDFSLNILVLGKSGVGKSATINSIFGEKKATIDAFEPATTTVKDFVGKIDGVKVRIFDTPGLRSSLMEQAFNRKILLSIRKVTKKCPPDIVLYVDQLDTQSRDLNDLPLLKSITSLLGSSIWHNAIVTLTHAASSPPDGPSGSPLNYDLYVAQRSRNIQQLISQAVGDLRLMNPTLMSPVSLVENHPSCQKGKDGQLVLPNGEIWRPQLLLLCYSMKILSEAKAVAKTQDLVDHRKLFGFRARSPPLLYLLSSLLQSNAHPKLPAEQGGDTVDSDTELDDCSDFDQEDEDEYDQLPPFKPLKRSQIAKLSKEQRKAYFEEYDYRVRVLQKKQLREEVRRLRELKKRGKDGPNNYGHMEEDGEEEAGSPAAIPVPLPDMVLPPSFDGDNPAHRYRFLEPTSQLLTRPVLDTHSWDHDCGYDGVNLESSLAIAGRLPALIAVQITKDKKDFNIHLDSSVAAKHGENGSTMVGFDIQTVGKQLAYILKGETKIKIYKTNKTAAGVMVTFLGENVATGLKIEDRIVIGKRLVLMGSTGVIRSEDETACGANVELRVREKDFPIGQDQTTLGLSLMRWRGDLIWGGNLQSQFSIGRSSKMVVRAGLNSKLSGQISLRTSSSDQLQIALLGILPIANAVFRNMFPQFTEKYLAQ